MLITWHNYDLNFSPQKSRMLLSAMPSNSGLSVSEIIASVFHEAVICVLLLQSFAGNLHMKHLQLLNNPSIIPVAAVLWSEERLKTVSRAVDTHCLVPVSVTKTHLTSEHVSWFFKVRFLFDYDWSNAELLVYYVHLYEAAQWDQLVATLHLLC